MSYYKESQTNYSRRILKYQIKWSLAEAEEGERFKKHCENVGMSAQQYIKLLIREDMERKGY